MYISLHLHAVSATIYPIRSNYPIGTIRTTPPYCQLNSPSLYYPFQPLYRPSPFSPFRSPRRKRLRWQRKTVRTSTTTSTSPHHSLYQIHLRRERTSQRALNRIKGVCCCLREANLSDTAGLGQSIRFFHGFRVAVPLSSRPTVRPADHPLVCISLSLSLYLLISHSPYPYITRLRHEKTKKAAQRDIGNSDWTRLGTALVICICAILERSIPQFHCQSTP